jgi:hypothetical protein
METFAETAIVDYRLLFADQGKQTSISISDCSKQTEVCHFCFPFAANKWKSPFSVKVSAEALEPMFFSFSPTA